MQKCEQSEEHGIVSRSEARGGLLVWWVLKHGRPLSQECMQHPLAFRACP